MQYSLAQVGVTNGRQCRACADRNCVYIADPFVLQRTLVRMSKQVKMANPNQESEEKGKDLWLARIVTALLRNGHVNQMTEE